MICRERDAIIEEQGRTIEEKDRAIILLQQRVQEIENKYKRAVLLYKNITEKGNIQGDIIGEKNVHINNLQYRLNEIEKRFYDMMSIKENNKQDESMKAGKRKNRIRTILFICLLVLAISIYILSRYIQEIIIYTI